MLIDSTPKDEMADVDQWNCSLHITLLLLVSESALNKVKTGLPDWCKNMTLGKPNNTYQTTRCQRPENRELRVKL